MNVKVSLISCSLLKNWENMLNKLTKSNFSVRGFLFGEKNSKNWKLSGEFWMWLITSFFYSNFISTENSVWPLSLAHSTKFKYLYCWHFTIDFENTKWSSCFVGVYIRFGKFQSIMLMYVHILGSVMFFYKKIIPEYKIIH